MNRTLLNLHQQLPCKPNPAVGNWELLIRPIASLHRSGLKSLCLLAILSFLLPLQLLAQCGDRTGPGLGTASASSVNGTNAAAGGFDNNTGTIWASAFVTTVSDGNTWIQYDFGTPTTINQYTIYPTLLNYQAVAGGPVLSIDPSAWTLQGSNTGVAGSWVNIESKSGVTFLTIERNFYNLASPQTYRFFRLVITASPADDITGIREMELNRVGGATTSGRLFYNVGTPSLTYNPTEGDLPLAGQTVTYWDLNHTTQLGSVVTDANGNYTAPAGLPANVLVQAPNIPGYVPQLDGDFRPNSPDLLVSTNYGCASNFAYSAARIYTAPVSCACGPAGNVSGPTNLITAESGGSFSTNTTQFNDHPYKQNFSNIGGATHPNLYRPLLAPATTGLTFSSQLQDIEAVLIDGTYNVSAYLGTVENIKTGFSTENNAIGGWRATFGANTGTVDDNFMVINGSNVPSFTTNEFTLLPGQFYQAATETKGVNSSRQVAFLPSLAQYTFTYQLLNAAGTVIASSSYTGGGATTAADDLPSDPWNTSSFCFQGPATGGPFRLRVTGTTGAAVGNDFALDNLRVTTCTVPISISGTVFRDLNGLSDGTVNGTGTNNMGGNTLYANLVNPLNGIVIASVPVAADGTYTFANVAPNSNFQVYITPTAGVVDARVPATTLAGGVYNTGEFTGTGAGSDGTANGIQTVTILAASITNVNFGLNTPPTANNVSQTYPANPGGTNTVVVPTLNGADVEQGTFPGTGSLDTVIITTLPASGILYYNGVAVTAGQRINNYNPALLTFDPVNGAGTYTFTYQQVDAAGAVSVPAIVTMVFPDLILSGTVFNDTDGTMDNAIDGTPINTLAGNTLYANLVNSAGNVVASVPVAADGTYSFGTANGVTANTAYTIVVSNGAQTIGAAPSSALTGGAVNTSEAVTSATGNPFADGNNNGSTAVTVGTTSIAGINFGIEIPPTAGSGINTAQNPSGTTQVTVPANTFTNTALSTDPTLVTAIRITAIPTGATTIVINGITYGPGFTPFPAGGVTVPTDASGNPIQTITVDPTSTGSGSVSIPFVAIDAAGKESANTGTAVLTFTIAISGNVYNDANGLNPTPANTVDGTGTNAGGLNAVLIDAVTGNVVATAPVAANGTYSFAGLNNGAYSVLITTAAATVGALPPAALLPTGYVSTGENLGAAAGSDGTVNAILPLGNVAANTINANFGIDRTTVADSRTYNVRESDFTTASSGGYPAVPGYFSIAASATVLTGQHSAMLSGSDPEDCAAAGSCNVNATYRIGAINANTLLYYDFGGATGIQPVAANTTIPNFNPANLRIYAADNGSGSTAAPIGFDYQLIDAAGIGGTPGVVRLLSSVPLPVELTSFGAVLDASCAAQISWVTASEHNTHAFGIEYSANGMGFAPVGEVIASKPLGGWYAFLYPGLPNGRGYFRLRIADYDGSFAYSPVATVNVTCEKAVITAKPNPVNTTLTVGGITVGHTIRVVSYSGAVVMEKLALATTVELDFSRLTAGSYILKVTDRKGNVVENRKVVKQ